MTKEIELKFNFNSKYIDRLLIFLHENAKIIHTKNLFLQNEYYDTPFKDLHANKIALRIRKVNHKYFLTIKTKEKINNGLFEREEWEKEISTDKVDIKYFPQKWQDFFLPLQHKLTKVFATNFQRQIWLIEISNSSLLNLASTKIEIAFDFGEIITQNNNSVISELELELKYGNKNFMLNFANKLQLALHLSINNKSKAERGYELLP